MRSNPDPKSYSDESLVRSYFAERAELAIPGRAKEILEMAGTTEPEPDCFEMIVPTLRRGNASGDAPASRDPTARRSEPSGIPTPERGNDLTIQIFHPDT
jgi:hypothetical protein